MYTHLHYRRFDPGPPRLISGRTLLFMLQRCCEKKAKRSYVTIIGKGTSDEPWRLGHAEEWLKVALTLTKQYPKDAWLTMGGRMLKKDARVYFSDQGPLWRYAQGSGNQTPATSMTYKGTAPTYQSAAQRVVRAHEVFPKDADNGEVVQLVAWNTVAHTPMLVRAIRSLLKRQAIDFNTSSPNIKHYSRMQASLPVLAAAMFLAEPARNLRAFPLNLMLLDLAECNISLDPGTHLTLDQILWHPDALDISQSNTVGGDQPPSKPVSGPVGANRSLRTVTRREQLHLVGGAMPASPTKGGELGGAPDLSLPDLPTPPSQVPVTNHRAFKEKWLRGQLNKKSQNFDYIHEKEVNVMLKWLSVMRPATFAAVNEADFNGATVAVPDLDVLFFDMPELHLDFKDIQNVFELRMDTLDKM